MRQERLMCLERELSGLEGYQGWMIGKCRFSFGDGAEQEAVPGAADAGKQSGKLRVLRTGSRLAEVEILSADERDRLTVTLVNSVPGSSAGLRRAETAERPPDPKYVQESRPAECFSATRAETDAYLEASGDCNPIHQGAHAVVPGFLMVNRIAQDCRNCREIAVRFYHPLYLGETARLIVNESGAQKSAGLFTEQNQILQMIFT